MFKWPWSKPEEKPQAPTKDKTEAVLTVILLKHRAGKLTTEETLDLVYRAFKRLRAK